jgi:hypothetical protein
MTMENVKVFVNSAGEEFVEIDRGNGEFTAMPKSTYDAMLGEQAKKLSEDVE